MGVEKEIFEEFFNQLESDVDFPDETLKELRKLYKNEKIASKDNILRSIKLGVPNEDQEH